MSTAELKDGVTTDPFEENQYESRRADGLKRLKSTAVPTKFVFIKSRPMSRKPPKIRPLACTEPIDPPAKLIHAEHSYTRFTADDNQQTLQSLSDEAAVRGGGARVWPLPRAVGEQPGAGHAACVSCKRHTDLVRRDAAAGLQRREKLVLQSLQTINRLGSGLYLVKKTQVRRGRRPL
ncbi:hypothetical protein GWK47_028629 [Chionoecetes opilio]|uniref:Uncharacterized protein n=1 Tax=Chionoecetes opilio TaxID=41210 RepID=A0A8J4YKZ9_CHIOP|nr:hypothetical protein GWK47_028629 [Chionoecetes opilio]